MEAKKAFQAFGKGHASVSAASPREAAHEFFKTNTKARKCTVVEGETQVMGGVEFFVSVVGRNKRVWSDVPRKEVDAVLPPNV